jgi:FkbM family methyltransferase
MAVSNVVHRFVRGLTGWYPFRIPAYGVNTFLSWIGFDGPDTRWMTAMPRGGVPGMVLNVSNRYHRKNYYFLKAYWREAKATPLGEFLQQTLVPGTTFLDVGAHLGFYSFLAASLVGPGGAVHAFEPDPLTVESLVQSASVNGSFVSVHPIALSDEPGVLPLHRATAQAHSLVSFQEGDARYTGDAQLVPVTTLDAWAAQAAVDLTTIGVVKVDVEGAEAKTIAGGCDLLDRAKCPPLWCEVRGPQGSTRAPDTFAAVVKVLSPLGYRPYRWRRRAAVPVEVAEVVGREDILFQRSSA